MRGKIALAVLPEDAEISLTLDNKLIEHIVPEICQILPDS